MQFHRTCYSLIHYLTAARSKVAVSGHALRRDNGVRRISALLFFSGQVEGDCLPPAAHFQLIATDAVSCASCLKLTEESPSFRSSNRGENQKFQR